MNFHWISETLTDSNLQFTVAISKLALFTSFTRQGKRKDNKCLYSCLFFQRYCILLCTLWIHRVISLYHSYSDTFRLKSDRAESELVSVRNEWILLIEVLKGVLVACMLCYVLIGIIKLYIPVKHRITHTFRSFKLLYIYIFFFYWLESKFD